MGQLARTGRRLVSECLECIIDSAEDREGKRMGLRVLNEKRRRKVDSDWADGNDNTSLARPAFHKGTNLSRF